MVHGSSQTVFETGTVFKKRTDREVLMTPNPASNAEPPDSEASNAEPPVSEPRVSGSPVSEARVSDPGVRIPPPPWQRAPDRPARRRKEPISRDASGGQECPPHTS